MNRQIGVKTLPSPAVGNNKGTRVTHAYSLTTGNNFWDVYNWKSVNNCLKQPQMSGHAY